jgi:hypothetical protein
VYLQRVGHAEGDAARVNPQLVGPQAVAVAEGVRDSQRDEALQDVQNLRKERLL